MHPFTTTGAILMWEVLKPTVLDMQMHFTMYLEFLVLYLHGNLSAKQIS